MSFDKHVSSLDELLDMSAPYFSKVKFESRINPKIEQHIKVSIDRNSRRRYGALTTISLSSIALRSHRFHLHTFSKPSLCSKTNVPT
jgi:hypothetical protein